VSLERQTREEAEFKAFLRAKRSYEKKLDDIRFDYEEFRPLLEAYKSGKLTFDTSYSPFAIESNASDAQA
jgi:hypothetical protein